MSRFATRWSEIEEVSCALVRVLEQGASTHARVATSQAAMPPGKGQLPSTALDVAGAATTIQPGVSRLLFEVCPCSESVQRRFSCTLLRCRCSQE